MINKQALALEQITLQRNIRFLQEMLECCDRDVDYQTEEELRMNKERLNQIEGILMGVY